MFNKELIELDSIDSTNNYTLRMKESLSFKEGLMVTASYQTGGNGQRGKSWESLKGDNLLISIVIEPNISIQNQKILYLQIKVR